MTNDEHNPVTKYRTDGFPEQQQNQPGLTGLMSPQPDHGEETYVGSGRLAGLVALITGGDSGIGRAVAIAYSREGANVALAYLPEEQEDADETAELIRRAGRDVLLLSGDLRDEDFSRGLPGVVVEKLGRLDIVVLNAAYQQNRDGLDKLSTDEFTRVMETNLYATLWIAGAALPHLRPGSSIISTSSIQAFNPSPNLIDYAMTKAALVAFTQALAIEVGPRGIRVNAVAPGPIWTPLILAEQATHFRARHSARPGRPARRTGSRLRLPRLLRRLLRLRSDPSGHRRERPLNSGVARVRAKRERL